MAFTNFCCRSGGSNLNAGTRTGSTTEPGTSADFTYASGSWVSTTRVFTVASGNPSTDGVAVGDFVSVFADGSTATGYVARVTAVTSTTITTSATALTGTAPSNGTNTRTLKVGGAWLGPNGANPWIDVFPAIQLLNVAGDMPRVNLKNDQTYSVTANINLATSDVRFIQGYTSAYGDGGRAVIDGGTSGASYVILSTGATSAATRFEDLEIRNNGATGSAAGMTTAGSSAMFRRCVIHDVRGAGVTAGATGNAFFECEVYACNQSNTASLGGVVCTGGSSFVRCVFHDNTGTNTAGVISTGAVACTFVGCVFDTNGSTATGALAQSSSGGTLLVEGCDFYANAARGIQVSGGIARVENSNFVLNGTYGVTAAGNTFVSLANCGFGSGTQANATADTLESTNADLPAEGSVTYTANETPWEDPAVGDFRLASGDARGAGRGSFLQTATSYAGTVAYVDIGAGPTNAYGLAVAVGLRGGLN